MHNYLDKSALYARVEELRLKWGIQLADYPLHTPALCENFKHIVLTKAPFKTPGLRGLATKRTDLNGTDIIILNSNRSEQEQNFDCGHELIHLTQHRNAKAQTFHCFEQTMPSQNTFLEWQANEGAAELILPYKLLIPALCQDLRFALELKIFAKRNLVHIPVVYAQRYNVTESFIKNRIQNLIYEICQYYEGIDIENIEILSNHQIKKSDINLKKFTLYPILKAI